jgi:hypothetical protein
MSFLLLLFVPGVGQWLSAELARADLIEQILCGHEAFVGVIVFRLNVTYAHAT